MIFVTVGSDLPFNRLVRVVDDWAAERGRTDVFAQIGETGWRPRHIPYCQFLEPAEFQQKIREASVIISHAGMGTILTALSAQRPILVMPRLHALFEIRNEHQLATVRRLQETGAVAVALDEEVLRERLDHLEDVTPPVKISNNSDTQLISALRDYIAKG